MLTDVHIHHFALIDKLELSLNKGMTVLTGETGAGKSIIIDAVSIALGERAKNITLFSEAEKCEIHLHFDITHIVTAKKWLEEHEMQNEHECIIRRVLHKDGRSKSFINQVPVTLPLLRELSSYLINIHGQHAFQNLLKAPAQRDLLDGYAKHHELTSKVSTVYDDWFLVCKEHKLLETQQDSRFQRVDYLRFQLEELDAFNLTTEELNILETEQKQLANLDFVLKQGHLALSAIEEQEVCALDQLNQAMFAVESISALHPSLQNTQQLLNQARLHAEEATSELKHYLDRLEANPERLRFVEERLSKAHDLARKHRTTLNQLPALHKTMQEELASLTHFDDALATLKEKMALLEKEYQEQAKKLSESRAHYAKELSQKITDYIHTLAMPNGQFKIELIKNESPLPCPHGMEKIQFLVSANPGQPLAPLQQVASGGELSRISLAIQTLTAKESATPTLIFDEVDVGIGGQTADIVGELLRELGKKTQVLCITHLPQVAAKGHAHLKVEKHQSKSNTQTTLVYLNADERIYEIARMAGGKSINPEALAHASTLLALPD